MAWWHTPLSSSMISSGTGNGVVAYTTPCTEFGGECYRAVGRGVPPDRGVPHRQRLHHQERQGRHGDVLGGDATPFMALKERASTHLWRRCNHSLPFDGAQTQSMHPFMASMHPFTLAASASYKYGKTHTLFSRACTLFTTPSHPFRAVSPPFSAATRRFMALNHPFMAAMPAYLGWVMGGACCGAADRDDDRAGGEAVRDGRQRQEHHRRLHAGPCRR
eukprot:115373-Rhodomonas_salina.1